MTDCKKKYPDCFGILESVFPKRTDGLRKTPDACFPCVFKTECLRTAMGSTGGLNLQEECVDRAYGTGMMKFFERWSRKKEIARRKKEMERQS